MERQTNICVLVGPNGNLTTLFGGIAVLHPEVEGFNHGFEVMHHEHITKKDMMLYKKPFPMVKNADILLDYSPKKVDNFVSGVHSVLHLRGEDVFRNTGKENRYDLLSAHTFKRQEMVTASAEIYGKRKERMPGAKCIFWKEGMLATKYLMTRNTELIGLREDPRISFFMPIRNPIDTYFSCKYKGFFPIMTFLAEDPMYFILYSIRWLYEVTENHKLQNRSLFLAEDEIDGVGLTQLQNLMGVNRSEKWEKAILNNIEIKAIRSYREEPTMAKVLTNYKELVEELFLVPGYNYLGEKLLKFAEKY